MDGDFKPDVDARIIWLIADTFDVSPAHITVATEPDEVNGWDSLGHSVLLTRIGRKFDLPMTEELAAPIGNVGELLLRIQAELGRVAHG